MVSQRTSTDRPPRSVPASGSFRWIGPLSSLRSAGANRLQDSSQSGNKQNSLATVVPAGAIGTGSQATPPVTRPELVWLLMLLGIGAVLRLVWPWATTIEHFDEGVYASNLWFDTESGNRYPFRHLYAPPLVPSLIEFVVLFQQLLEGSAAGAGLAALLPSLVLGCATPALIWWLARCWIGREAAWGAVTLCSLSEFHALFSRAALTDVVLLFWLLLAMQFGYRALQHLEVRWALAAGAATGLAWQTKYNGWLPLFMLLTGLLVQALLSPAARRFLVRRLGLWSLILTVSVGFWLPVLWWLQPTGGYSAVLANHRTYVVGLEGWVSSFCEQATKLHYLEGWIGCLAPSLAWGVVLVSARRRFFCSRESNFAHGPESEPFNQATRPRSPVLDMLLPTASCFGLLATSCWLGSVGACVLLMGAAMACEAWHLFFTKWRPFAQAAGPSGPDSAGNNLEQGDLSLWLLGTWFLTLLVLTPLYWPYPRLTVPWVGACWLGGGWAMTRLIWLHKLHSLPLSSAPRRSSPLFHLLLGSLIVISVIGLLPQVPRLNARGVVSWQDRTGLAQVAQQIANRVGGESAVVLVYAEPALFFQLRTRGVACFPTADPVHLPRTVPSGVSVYLVSGWHAASTEVNRSQPTVASGPWHEVQQFPYRLSDLVSTDQRYFQPATTTDEQMATARLFQLNTASLP